MKEENAMTCVESNLRLCHFAAGELDAEERFLLRRHLEACPSCREEATRLRAVFTATTNAWRRPGLAEWTPDPAMARRLFAAHSPASRRRPCRHAGTGTLSALASKILASLAWCRPSYAAAGLIVFVAAGLWAGRFEAPHPADFAPSSGRGDSLSDLPGRIAPLRESPATPLPGSSRELLAGLAPPSRGRSLAYPAIGGSSTAARPETLADAAHDPNAASSRDASGAGRSSSPLAGRAGGPILARSGGASGEADAPFPRAESAAPADASFGPTPGSGRPTSFVGGTPARFTGGS
jgi:anti-sigma factor RsiW